MRIRSLPAVAVVAAALAVSACGADRRAERAASPSPEASSLTVYSGRSEELVGPILKRFEETSGITLNVRYGDTAELASTILEEGSNSPADVFFGQDAGALGAVQQAGRFRKLPAAVLDRVPAPYRSAAGDWVGTSGRARTLVYNTERVRQAALPSSVLDLAETKWRGKVAWAPTNGSFQAFVTALRLLRGDEPARAWIAAMQKNGVKSYPKNSAIVEAVASGEVDAGLVNHYYLFQLLRQKPDLKAANHFFAAGDAGALVNVAGVGILRTSKAGSAAERLVTYLLSDEAQRLFAQEAVEYPLVGGVSADSRLPALDALQPPDLDLSRLSDLQGTLTMLQQAGAL